MRHEAVIKLYPNVHNQVNDKAYDVNGNEIILDENKIESETSDMLSKVPMQRLREERDRRLAETDWWAVKEVDGWQMSPQQRVYRKNLRDMPQTSPYPMLNENGELTNVDWPEKP
jgi:hypothetical protein